ncbi:M-phase inducer phosphatase 1-B-like [Polyodon spathula]|uniref:M-phase inducer phosphatase 1-B-like n=1 Tax=Polyodon spathula TaxID=7913 RepID=UPI001B7E332A|nr:M-phase inducer phosphatase 1-B-like [Polyodon spathula]
MSENPSSGPGSSLSFRSGCRMLLNLVRERDSFVSSPEKVMSPITDLANNFSNLSAFAGGDTPKRCLDLSNLSSNGETLSPLTASPDTRDSDHPVSPCHLESPVQRHQKVTPEPDSVRSKKPHIKRFKRILPNLLCSSPKCNDNSKGMQLGVVDSSPMFNNKENDPDWFKKPNRAAPHSLNLQNTDLEKFEFHNGLLIPDVYVDECEMNVPCSPITLGGFEEHDGYMEIINGDERENYSNANISSSMALLLSDPLMSQEMDFSIQAPKHRSRKGLFRSPSMPEKLNRPLLKRACRQQDVETPVKIKRRKSISSPIQEEREEEDMRTQRLLLKKTLSLCDVDISKALDEDVGHKELIGDFTKVYALPTVTGRHQDLKYITAETMAAVLCGEFSSLIEKYFILDCRYPYEYEGGHIKGALNLHKQDDISNFFLTKIITPTSEDKRVAVIFHCEFSSERGPKMCRFLRKEDRSVNVYPALHYPELYILKGGYKDFFPEFKMWCEPQSYCPMHHEDYKDELLKFRTRSKSWAGERRRREQITRLMKL